VAATSISAPSVARDDDLLHWVPHLVLRLVLFAAALLTVPVVAGADRSHIVAHDIPPYPPLRSIQHSRPSTFKRCMNEQRRQGFHGSDAWEHARHYCAHGRH